MSEKGDDSELRKCAIQDVQSSGAHSSDDFWKRYLVDAKKQDKISRELWNNETDSILVFTGLFAAVVTTFISASSPLLAPDPAGDTVVLLTQLVALANSSQTAPSASPATDTFKPSTAAVTVNSLWFLSLFTSLVCALMATLVQRWARQYEKDTSTVHWDGSPHVAGPMHAFLSRSFERIKLGISTEAIFTLLHTSVFLFFAGLIVYLFILNNTVAWVVTTALILSGLVYLIPSVFPFFSKSFVYGTPMTGPLLVLMFIVIMSISFTLSLCISSVFLSIYFVFVIPIFAIVLAIAAICVVLALPFIPYIVFGEVKKLVSKRSKLQQQLIHPVSEATKYPSIDKISPPSIGNRRIQKGRAECIKEFAQETTELQIQYALRSALRNVVEEDDMVTFFDTALGVISRDSNCNDNRVSLTRVNFLVNDENIFGRMLVLLDSCAGRGSSYDDPISAMLRFIKVMHPLITALGPGATQRERPKLESLRLLLRLVLQRPRPLSPQEQFNGFILTFFLNLCIFLQKDKQSSYAVLLLHIPRARESCSRLLYVLVQVHSAIGLITDNDELNVCDHVMAAWIPAVENLVDAAIEHPPSAESWQEYSSKFANRAPAQGKLMDIEEFVTNFVQLDITQFDETSAYPELGALARKLRSFIIESEFMMARPGDQSPGKTSKCLTHGDQAGVDPQELPANRSGDGDNKDTLISIEHRVATGSIDDSKGASVTIPKTLNMV